MRDLTDDERKNLIEIIAKGWKGNKNGYATLEFNKKKYKRSRLMMQLYLNKHLEIWEFVHHVDENKGNDTINNFQVLTAEEHGSHHHAGVSHKNKS